MFMYALNFPLKIKPSKKPTAWVGFSKSFDLVTLKQSTHRLANNDNADNVASVEYHSDKNTLALFKKNVKLPTLCGQCNPTKKK
jgi:formate dehydrogenase assembly factor FdhD